MIEIDLSTQDEATVALWDELLRLTESLPTGWVLVGGLMVQTHLVEAGGPDVRVTTDIDLLGQARPEGALNELGGALRRLGFKLGDPDEDGYSHRFTKGDLTVDVLAPDGLRRGAEIFGRTKTVGIPGGSQALARQEQIRVRTPTGSGLLLRPSLLGAILIKARALIVHKDPEAQLQDLVSLLAVLGDPAEAATELKGREATWLRRAAPRVDVSPQGLVAGETLRLARLALALLAPMD